MATEREQLDDAANARATRITWDEFLERVRPQAGFDYRSTPWYPAGAFLEQLKSIPPRPRPTPLGVSSAQARIFLAQSPLDCRAAPPWMEAGRRQCPQDPTSGCVSEGHLAALPCQHSAHRLDRAPRKPSVVHHGYTVLPIVIPN